MYIRWETFLDASLRLRVALLLQEMRPSTLHGAFTINAEPIEDTPLKHGSYRRDRRNDM